MSEESTVEDQKAYEVSFLLTEESVIADIDKAIEGAGMQITNKGQLQNLKLAYPIKKHDSAFFGYYHIAGLPENIKKVKEALALNPKILRILVLTPPIIVAPREIRSTARDSQTPTQEIQSTASGVNVAAPKPEEVRRPEPAILSNEGLEKKLEEILK